MLMELKIDLSGNMPKSNWRIVFGVIFCLLSICYLLRPILVGRSIEIWDCFLAVIWLFVGGAHIFEGTGRSFDKLFGKTYTIINDEKIITKSSSLASERSIYWNDIVSIEYVFNTIYITKSNKNKQRVLFSRSDTVIDTAAKDFVEKMGVEKGIELTGFDRS